MKGIKKGICLSLAATMLGGSVAALASCGGNEVDDGEQSLQVYCLDVGYGVQWCTDLLEAFQEQQWVKDKYPNLQVFTTYNDVRTYAVDRINSPSNNTFDLMFGNYLYDLSGKNSAGEESILDLTEIVYNQTVPGENVKFIEKIYQSYNESNVYRAPTEGEPVDQYYIVPWAGGMNSIIYNQEILDNYGITTINTTDEWIEACATIKATPSKSGNDGGYSIMRAGNTGYWSYLFYAWWAQYDGIESYVNFYKGIYEDEDGIKSYSNKIFELLGRQKSLEIFEEVLDYDKGYFSPEAFTKEDFMLCQTDMLDGKYAFMVNGDWFDREMQDMSQAILDAGDPLSTIRMMKLPIVSSIIEKCPTIANDAELSALITAIDAGNTALSGTGYEVSPTDYEKVKEARTVVHTIGPGHHGAIPANATAKDVAVDFLLFMATDIAQEEYIRSTSGCSLPFYYNVKEKNPDLYAELSPFQQARLDYFCSDAYEVYSLPATGNFPLVKYGELTAIEGVERFDSIFSAQGNTQTAKGLFDLTKSVWTEQKFAFALDRAGIVKIY